MSVPLKAREMLKEVHVVNGREYCCYIKGNCSDDRTADLVFFNGLFSGASSWAYQTRMPALLKHYRLVMFDYPCQGGSAAVTEGMTAFDLLQELTVLLTQLGVKKPLLIGHSVGGMLGGIMAGLHASDHYLQAEIQGLLIANSGASLPDSTKNLFDDIQARLMSIHEAGLSAPEVRNAIKDVFRSFIPQALDKGYQEMMLPFMDDLLEGYADYNPNPQALAFLLKILSERDTAEKPMMPFLRQATCPVRVVAGANDRIFPPAQVQEMADAFVNADFFSIADAGHSVMLEQSRAFNELLLDFVNRVFGPASVETGNINFKITPAIEDRS